MKEQALSQARADASSLQTLKGEHQQQYINIHQSIEEKKELDDLYQKTKLEQASINRKYEALKAREADLQKELDQEKLEKEELRKAHSEQIENLQNAQLELQRQLSEVENQRAQEVASLRADLQSRG